MALLSGGSRISQTEGGANPKGGNEKLLFGQIFPKNCMKMKEIEPGGRESLAPLLRSATVTESASRTIHLLTSACLKGSTHPLVLIPDSFLGNSSIRD